MASATSSSMAASAVMGSGFDTRCRTGVRPVTPAKPRAARPRPLCSTQPSEPTAGSRARGAAAFRVVTLRLSGATVACRRPSKAGPRDVKLQSAAGASTTEEDCFPSESCPAVAGISENDAMMNVIKGIMGAGCFALPWAYAQTGLVFTSVYLFAAAALCLYCISLMQRARKQVSTVLCDVDPAISGVPDMSTYAGLAYDCLGRTGGVVAEGIILSCCLGFCSAFMVFIGSTMHTLVPAFSQNQLVGMITPIMIALAWIRNFGNVSLISALGNASVAIGLLIVLVYGLSMPAQWGAIPLANIAKFPETYGSVAFLFFIHFMLPPVEASMKEPQKFLSASAKAFFLCSVASAIFGTLGAVYFGAGVSSVIISMLSGGLITVAVKLLLCANLLCTFPLCMRSAFDIVEGMMGGGGEQNLSDTAVYSMRTCFVLLGAAAAVGIPSFGKLLALVGGVSCTALTMIFPPIMLWGAYSQTSTKLGLMDTIGCLLTLGGGLVLAALTVVSVL